MKHWPIAIQLYSVRDEATEDFTATVRSLKAMGYDGVELAGTYGMTACQVKEILDREGLALVSAHAGAEAIEDDSTLDDYAATGMRYIAIPWMEEPKNEEELAASVARLEKAGDRCRARGMELLYHNHIMEFNKVGNTTILDAYFSQVSPELLNTELDLCWVEMADVEPAAYLRKFPGRAPLVHIKDYYGEKSEGEAVEQRPLGHGMVKVTELLEAAEEMGTQWLIVEQDDPTPGLSPMECAQKSAQYLKELIGK